MESVSLRIEQLLSVSRAIYIIDPTGILLHNEFFLGQDDDPDLYAGLFTALNAYAKELDAGEIQNVRLEDSKFIFNQDPQTGYLVVLDVNTEMLDNDGEWLLEQIMKRFDAMKNLLAEDFKGSLTLETLFDDRGKEINWGTIQSIREDAIENQKKLFDKVETLNLTKINMKNRTWVKIRNVIASMVENQKGLLGSYLIIHKRNHNNILYSGRDKEKLEGFYNYLLKKMGEIVGLELETERINIDDMYCSIYPLLCEDGGLLAIASEDKYLVARLNNQIERMVAAIEKLCIST